MDDKIEALKVKLDRLMREAAETAADLQAAERGARPRSFHSNRGRRPRRRMRLEQQHWRAGGAGSRGRHSFQVALSRLRHTLQSEVRSPHHPLHRRACRRVGTRVSLPPLSAGFFSLNAKRWGLTPKSGRRC